MMKETEEKTKLLDKLKIAEVKAKKHNDAVNEAKRKQELIKTKSAQIDSLNEQLAFAQKKAMTADKYYNQNKDLVTRKCALESAVSSRDKTIQQLNDRVSHLEMVVRQLE